MIPDDDLLFYDLTAIHSITQNLKIIEKGYNANNENLPQIGISLAFSSKNSIPVAIDLSYGSMKDIKTIRNFIDRLPKRKKFGFIFDMGFSSYKLIKDLIVMGIHYMVPTKSNLKINPDPRSITWERAFSYQERAIRWCKCKSDLGFIYTFEDPLAKGEQDSTKLNKVSSKIMTMAEYEESKYDSGIFSILSDLDSKGDTIFEQYKSREAVEVAFDALKNELESDKVTLRTNEGIRGYFFLSFLSLRIYFKILQRLKELGISNKISVEEVLFELSKVEKIIEKNGNEYFAAIPKKTLNILNYFKDQIPMV